MRLVVKSFSQKEWTDVVSEFQDLSLLQTWEYGEAKARTSPWQVWRAVFVSGDRIQGAVQSMVRRVLLLGGGLVWVNRGPLWRRSEDEDPARFQAMLKALRDYWVQGRGMYLRIAPVLREGEPASRGLEGDGYRLDEASPGWASARLDLTHPSESLRSNLQQKWRNCLNKAERLEIKSEFGSDSAFHEVLGCYEELLREREYPASVTPSLLEGLQSLLPDEWRLRAFVARHGPQQLGGILIARYGDISEDLVGAVTKAGRSLNAGNLLLWQAICHAKALGCRWFDLGGMDPERTPSGILHFKAGLGGIAYRLVGELETDDGGWRGRIIRWRVRRRLQAGPA